MRIFGFSVVTAKAMDKVHARHRSVMAELEDMKNNRDHKSLQRQIVILEDQVEALKVKCSRVNVSALENRCRALEETIRIYHEKLSSDVMPLSDTDGIHILQSALGSASDGHALGTHGVVAAEGEGFDLAPEEVSCSRDLFKSEGD